MSLSIRVFDCIFNTAKTMIVKIAFSIPPSKTGLQGHLRKKVGGEAKSFACSCKGDVPFP